MDVLRQRLSHYADISDEMWEDTHLLSNDKASFTKGEDLIEEGEKTSELFILEQGWAVRYRTLEDGRRQICNFMVPGDIFDLQALSDLDADHTVTATTDVVCLVVPQDKFLTLINKSAALASRFWWAAVQEESILREQIVRIGRRSGRERIGHLLLELQRRISLATGEDPDQFTLPVTRVDLADALGLTPVHVSRTMSAMRRAGLIVERGGEIEITDKAALVRLAQFDSDYLHIRRYPANALT